MQKQVEANAREDDKQRGEVVGRGEGEKAEAEETDEEREESRCGCGALLREMHAFEAVTSFEVFLQAFWVLGVLFGSFIAAIRTR